MKKTTLMTEGSIFKSIMLFSIPLILGNLLQQLYNTVDSIIVGNYIGKGALAAVGACGSPIYLLLAFYVGASAGAGVLISRYYGAKDKRNLQQAVHTTLAIAIITGVGITIIGIALSEVILKLMGTPEAVMPDAVLYFRIFFCGMIFNVIYNMGAGILNAVGNSTRSLIYLAIASVSNIVLDFVFVVCLKWGVAGVAIATDISQLISSILVIRFLFRVPDMYRAKLKRIRLHKTMAKNIIKIGLPTAIQNMVISLSNVLIQSSVNASGPDAMAGFAAYLKVDGFNILPVMSFSLAATTYTGQNLGAGETERVRRGLWSVLMMGVVYTVVLGGLMLIFGRTILSIFNKDPNVIDYGMTALQCLAPGYFLLSIMHCLAGTIRGAGKTVPPMIIILFALCIFRIIWLQLVASNVGTYFSVMLAYPISFVIGAALMSLYAWKGKWRPVLSEQA